MPITHKYNDTVPHVLCGGFNEGRNVSNLLVDCHYSGILRWFLCGDVMKEEQSCWPKQVGNTMHHQKPAN
jgi:hypothetical protein